MARITVEDCIKRIPNRFDLVLAAAKRARKLSTGAVEACLDWENDKPTVLALREIAAGFEFKDEEEQEQQVQGDSTQTPSESLFSSN